MGEKRHVGMFENFCIFGTGEQTIQDYIGGKSGYEIEGDILYSIKEKHDIEIQSSKFVFPSGMAIKKYSSSKAK